VVVSKTAILKSKANPRLTPQYNTLTYLGNKRISEDGKEGLNMPTYRRISKSPRAGNKYRVAIDGVPVSGPKGLLTKSEILTLGIELLEEGRTFSLGPTQRQTKSGHSTHSSKYDRKRRR
jgi:hypothetical protein